MIYWIVSAVVLDGFVISANIIELALLLKKWNRLDRIEHLLFSLCVADLICGLSMFGQDVFQLKMVAENRGIEIDQAVGVLLDCLIIFFILVSNFHVTAIAIERIVAVSFPLKYSIFTTYTCKVFTISLVWTSALLLAPTITVINKTVGNNSPNSHVFGQLLTAGVMLTACVTVFISYMLLTYLLVRRAREMKILLEPEMRRQLRDRRTTLFCLVFGFSFLICLLPYTLGLFSQSLFHMFEILLLTVYHLVNPLVYFVKTYGDKTRGRSGTTTLNSATNLITRSPNMTRTTTIMSHSPSMVQYIE